MKKTVLIGVLIIFLASCAIRNKSGEYVVVYESPQLGDLVGPCYLILRGSKYYEFYFPWGATSDFGEFKISNDTLCIYPSNYEYYHREHSLKEEATPTEVSFSSIPIYYKMVKDKLIDITEYEKYPELVPFLWMIEDRVYSEFVRIMHK
jgi:hypothetical protein